MLDINITDLHAVKIFKGKGIPLKVDNYKGRVIAALTDLPQYIILPPAVKIVVEDVKGFVPKRIMEKSPFYL